MQSAPRKGAQSPALTGMKSHPLHWAFGQRAFNTFCSWTCRLLLTVTPKEILQNLGNASGTQVFIAALFRITENANNLKTVSQGVASGHRRDSERKGNAHKVFTVPREATECFLMRRDRRSHQNAERACGETALWGFAFVYFFVVVVVMFFKFI